MLCRMENDSNSAMISRYTSRQSKFNQTLNDGKLNSMLVFGPENINYLTGFTGNAAYLIASPKKYILITDYRYFERAQQECQHCDIVCRDRSSETLGACIQRHLPSGDTGFDAAYITVNLWQEIATTLDRVLRPITGLIEQLRTVKCEWEVTNIKKAAAIADLALADMLGHVRLGVTEKDLATELDYKMQKLGSDGVSFDTILLFGSRSALPHGKPGNTQLKEGDMILIDFGAVVNGYRSDMTRTYVYQSATAKQQHMYDTVIAAQNTSLELVKSGTNCIELNAASERVLFGAGYEEYAGKGLGHGLGLHLHETPFITPKTHFVLQAGNVITIEPGIYIPELGGVRIEDDILVTHEGFECLTHAPKQFIVE